MERSSAVEIEIQILVVASQACRRTSRHLPFIKLATSKERPQSGQSEAHHPGWLINEKKDEEGPTFNLERCQCSE